MSTYVNAIKVVITNTTFAGTILRPNENIVSVDLKNTSFENGNANQAFLRCNNLTSVTNFPSDTTNMYGTFAGCAYLTNIPTIPNSITNLDYTYSSCNRLVNTPTIPNSVVTMDGTFADCNLGLREPPVIPNSVTSMQETFRFCANLRTVPLIPNAVTTLANAFWNCINITGMPIIPESMTNMYSAFNVCTNLTGNIYIKSNQITNANGCFDYSTLTKNVYIPFTYENGVNTQTYNSFIAAGYDETGTSMWNVYLKDINTATLVTFGITQVPSDANVVLTVPGYTQIGNTIQAPIDAMVYYTVSKSGYVTQSGATKAGDVYIPVRLQVDTTTTTK